MRKRTPHSHHTSQHPIRQVKPKHTRTFKSNWLWILGGSIGAIAFFWLLKPVLGLLSASAAIAYIANPIVKNFESKGLSRDQSILSVVCIGLLIGLVFLLGLLPPVIVQIDNLSYDIDRMIIEIDQGSQGWIQKVYEVTGWNVQIDWPVLRSKIPEWTSNISSEWQSRIGAIAKGLLLMGMGLISALLNLLLLPIFTYYLLRDWDSFLELVYDLLPIRSRTFVSKTMMDVDSRLNAFVIGQIKVCAALAVLYSIGLWFVGIDLAIPVGIVSGLLFIIPYLGTIFGIFTASLLALINFGLDWHVFGVFGVFAIVQTIEGYYLTPKIIGGSVGLSAMVVMIALIVGASIMGIWGMFLAIPVTAVLSVFTREWIDRYQQSGLYLDDEKSK